MRVRNKITSCKFLIASCELPFTRCKFKEINLRVASCVLWAKKSKILFYELPAAFYKLKVEDDKSTSWMFKMIKFMSCEVTFYKLNICDANFTNYHHIFESNFNDKNIRKLWEEAISIKCILTLHNSNTHQSKFSETVIRTFDQSNFSIYRNYLAVWYNCFMYHYDHFVSFRVWVIKSKL